MSWNHRRINDNKKIVKKQAAEDLSLTRTSITRSSKQLKQMGLIAEEQQG
jgi:DNA-binding MarR family transcriptional regulator